MMMKNEDDWTGWRCHKCNAPVSGPYAKCPNCGCKPERDSEIDQIQTKRQELYYTWIELTNQFSELKCILQNDIDEFTDDNLTEWLIRYSNYMKDQINLFQKTIEYIFEQMNKTPTEKVLLQRIWRELKPQNKR